MHFRVLPIFCVVFPVLASCADGQTTTEVLKSAAHGNWFVRANSQAGVMTQGRVLFFDSTRIEIGRVPIRASAISSIERRMNRGGGWKTGSAVGAAAGAIFGYGLAGLCESDCGGAQLGGIVIFGGVGVLLGGVVGQIVHPPAHYWLTIYPAHAGGLH